jgi:hypothetical protein
MSLEDVPEVVLDPERGRVVAHGLRALGVKEKDELIKAAEQGYITELVCAMPKCFCPEELGGRSHFAARTETWNYWEPTFEHFPIPKRGGGRKSVDNAVLAHRLCNKLDFFIFQGLSMEKDLARVEEQRQEAIRVRFERFNTEDVYVVPPESTDAQEMHEAKADEPQS